MKISELPNAPAWLRAASTSGEDVEMQGGVVIWLSGTWYGGEWYGGVWRSGEWLGGTWYGGVWRSGEWRGGTYRGLTGGTLTVEQGDWPYGPVIVYRSPHGVRIDCGCRRFNCFTMAEAHWSNRPDRTRTLEIVRRLARGKPPNGQAGG
jgi:hypothetical protein